MFRWCVPCFGKCTAIVWEAPTCFPATLRRRRSGRAGFSFECASNSHGTAHADHSRTELGIAISSRPGPEAEQNAACLKIRVPGCRGRRNSFGERDRPVTIHEDILYLIATGITNVNGCGRTQFEYRDRAGPNLCRYPIRERDQPDKITSATATPNSMDRGRDPTKLVQ